MDILARELRRGTLELLLLALLSEEEQYGYRLVTELRDRSEGLIAIKEGTLYPVLYRLEEQGQIEPTWEHRDNRERGVPRKYYRLTSSGMERLEELRTEWSHFTSTVDSILNTRLA